MICITMIEFGMASQVLNSVDPALRRISFSVRSLVTISISITGNVIG